MFKQFKITIGFAITGIFIAFSYTAQAATDCHGQQILTAKSCIGDDIDSEESKLHQLVNEYRAQYGLAAIPLSPSLNLVANRHILDLVDNISLYSRNGQHWLHGWSDCPYDANNQETHPCIWEAPQRLGTAYTGYGYENLCGSPEYPNYVMTADYALICWQGSSAHNAVILNQGTWQNHPWNALGVGIYKGYAVLWFGEDVDPAQTTPTTDTSIPLNNGSSITDFDATSFLEQITQTITTPTTQPTQVSNGEIWQASPEPSSQGYIPIDRFRADDGNLWHDPLRLQPSGVIPNGTYDATQFPPDAYKQAIEGFFQIRYACEASWYGGAKDLSWIPANVVGAIGYCVYPENIQEVVNHLRATADSLACSAGLETCQ